ncbi:hypothetical protein C8A00DRAFT_34132 [Chaetomidium leptoderma]|uniref:Heme oxygenase-like protein n=1 Tax=Chaetomidium leptoderma TaxID=669021 RepID=A0AAN6ZV58_9PEZI|nr:hypothetical protein C8A00DRAFT_34132 [Chaetomidium leptoderma]
MGSQDDTPSSQAQPHLGDSINIATRALHAKLNKTILQHFPLALPPHTTNPSAYLTGLLHIAPIYLAFESIWQSILDAAESPPLDPSQSPSPSTSSNRTHTLLLLLQTLHHPRLTRTSHLLADIHALTNWPKPTIPAKLRQLLHTTTAAGDEDEDNNLNTFLTHITQSTTARPHVLLAYAWVLYMALFAGGTVLRAALEGAGVGFWGGGAAAPEGCDSVFFEEGEEKEKRGRTEPVLQECLLPPLGFFRFEEGEGEGGEDLKGEFKRRFGEAGRELTVEEREEVVREAGRVFEGVAGVVAQLDLGAGWFGVGEWVLGRLGVGKQKGGTLFAGVGKGKGGQRSVYEVGAWSVVALLMVGVGLGLRYAWK